jgi:hypothetical protein
MPCFATLEQFDGTAGLRQAPSDAQAADATTDDGNTRTHPALRRGAG